MKIGTGDDGYTRDCSGRRIPKDDVRIVCVGKIDTLQAAIEKALVFARLTKNKNEEVLEWMYRNLYRISGEVASAGESITEQDLRQLNDYVTEYGPMPMGFVRFDNLEAAVLNECRVRCRELETVAVKLKRMKKMRKITYTYLNRASLLFFAMAYEATR